MPVLGVIAEYNPFHKGHLYHLESAKKSTHCDQVVVVMSPNFVQRGMPAIVDKWTRTKMALLSGADLVIELPTPYATGSAEFFAHAGISLLNHTGIINHVNFGSESKEIDLLSDIALILADEPKAYKVLLKAYLNTGIVFPKAREMALIDYAHTSPKLSAIAHKISDIIQSPNNILALEYLKALKRLNSPMVPSLTQRKGAGYHEATITGPTASATAIRLKIQQNQWQDIVDTLPPPVYDLLYHHDDLKDQMTDHNLFCFLCYRLLFSSSEDLRNIVGINEGMENRILNSLGSTQSLSQMVSAIKSKRFTQTAVQRMLLHIILQIKKDDFNTFQAHGGPQYIRVLGFKKSASHLLRKIKTQASLPLVMNVKKDYQGLTPLGQKMLDLEIRTTNIYFALHQSHHGHNLDYTHPLIIIP